MLEESICAHQHAVPMVGYAWIRGQSNRERAGHANAPYDFACCTLLSLRHATRPCDRVGCRIDARDRGLQRAAIERIELELEPARFLDQRRIAKRGVERLA